MTDWFKLETVSEGVLRITEPFVHPFFRANLYRIAGRDFDIQLDFGVGVASLFSAMGDAGKPVLAVATHAHVDHVGSFHEYPRRAGHAAEAATFATMDDDGTLASWFVREPNALEGLPSPGFTMSDFRLQPAALTQVLAGGDRINTGSRVFTVLHLPGHSPGSIALLDEHNGEFFSGDAIYDDELVDDIPGADIETYLATMSRLARLDIRIGHGGHGESFGKARMQEIAREYLVSKGAV
jgi:glyoxylase-like metal-dependent hydrolase (beta-lactamase superfamily II)